MSPETSPKARHLHVQNVDPSNPQLLITDAISNEPLYRISKPAHHFSLKSQPDLLVSSAPTNTEIGSIRFHSLSDDIDLTIHGQHIKFSNRTFSAAHVLRSSITDVGKLTWKESPTLLGESIICTDSKGVIVAQLSVGTSGNDGKQGNMELNGIAADGGAAMDEVVVSGIAMVEWQRKHSDTEAWDQWPMFATAASIL